MATNTLSDGPLIDNVGEESREKLWSEFVAITPDLAVPRWNALLEDVDLIPQLDAH